MADWETSSGTTRRKPRAGVGRRPSLVARGIAAASLVMVSIAVVAAAAIGMAYVRIQYGPISLKPLAGLIEAEINAELSGLVAQVDDAQIAMSDDGRGVEMRLANLRLATKSGDTVASVPSAAIELSGLALRSARLVPSRIELIEPRVSVAYTDAGGFKLMLDARDRKPDGRIGRASAVDGASSAGGAGSPVGVATGGGDQFDLAALIASATDRSQRKSDGPTYLREIAIKDAFVSVDNRGALSEWRIAEGSIDLDRSTAARLASGRARVASSRGPWTVAFEVTGTAGATGAGATGAATGRQDVSIVTTVRDVNPRVLGLAMPQLAMLQPLDLPVSGDIRIDVLADGAVSAAAIAFEGSAGTLVLPSVTDAPFNIDRVAVGARYSKGRLDLDTATLAWGNSVVALKGVAKADTGGRGWAFGLATERGQLAADEFGVEPMALTEGALQGRYVPATGTGPATADEIRFDRIALAAGGAQLTGTGGVRTGPAGGGFFEAKLGATTVDRLKALWPRGIANGARSWVGERIRRGAIRSATIKFYNGGYANDAGVPAGVEPRRLSIALEAADVTAVPLAWLSPIEAPRLLMRLEDNALEVNIPDAHIALGGGRRVPIKGGRFSGSDLDKPAPTGEVTFRATAGVVPVLEVLDQSPLRLLRNNQISTDGLDGKADGNIKLTFPLIAGLLARDVNIEAKAKLSDVKGKQLGGAFDAQAGSFAIDVTPVAVDASGEFLVNGVPIKLGWQRILEDNGEKQPPLRLSAVLDNADRDQLGIDINHIIQGEVPVEILIEKGADKTDPHTVKLRADLTNAEIAFESIAWRKARGRSAILQADIVKGKTHKVELQNLRLEGDDITMHGTAAISADNRLREIELTELALNVVSRVQINAMLKTDGNDKTGVWQVKVKGRNFDGRDLFRSLLSLNSAPERPPAKAAKPSAALELDAEIDNVIGHNDVSVRGLKLKLTRRGEKLVTLDARGTMDGGGPVAVAMAPVQPGAPRLLLADTTDAGQAFRLIGFYPNMRSGRGRLEVNVDGRGPAEKTGTLWVDDFRVLGDAVVAELARSPGSAAAATGGRGGGPAAAGRQGRASGAEQPTDSVEFDRMKVPFSVGHGQFVVENAYLRGPLQGVAMTGKVDFRMKTVNLGGTFIPLQGLNNAFSGVPLFGELLSDGVFGLTFAIQGSLGQPQVLVNPLSIVAPGILRELTQMTNPNPQVVPRDNRPPAAPIEKRVRATPPAVVEPGRSKEAPRSDARPPTGGGWSSEVGPTVPSVPPTPQPAKRPAKKPAKPVEAVDGGRPAG
ncbi:MAG: DUF3971 domain-containing protein [Hyphomicrobium aestuarii]|nr:DUF3971 domain-containing protein [Hyphomicrobium aestuarii]